jgi:amidohydrolase
LIADIEPSISPAEGVEPLPIVALRADIDALPLQDVKDVPYRSTVAGVCHACGHDVHTTALLGAGLVLAELRELGLLTRPVRLIFQPAEEIMPGGATDAIASGALAGVQQIFALHCDPNETVGRVGLKIGGITASADQITIRLTGPGGHTARPHMTADLVYALAEVATRLPGVLSRRVDPRAGLSVVWGRIVAGATSNVIPDCGEISGTVRSLDADSWELSHTLVPAVAREILEPLGVTAEIEYVRGVPPVMNAAAAVNVFERAVRAVLGDEAVVPTPQSLGGEDFAWYANRVPGAMARLGVRPPGAATTLDLHRADFDADERAIGIGTRVHVATALTAIDIAESAAG